MAKAKAVAKRKKIPQRVTKPTKKRPLTEASPIRPSEVMRLLETIDKRLRSFGLTYSEREHDSKKTLDAVEAKLTSFEARMPNRDFAHKMLTRIGLYRKEQPTDDPLPSPINDICKAAADESWKEYDGSFVTVHEGGLADLVRRLRRDRDRIRLELQAIKKRCDRAETVLAYAEAIPEPSESGYVTSLAEFRSMLREYKTPSPESARRFVERLTNDANMKGQP